MSLVSKRTESACKCADFPSGLLPLLKSIHKPCNLKKFAGQTIGVDAYGWLHRGTVACAIDLALGKPTKKYDALVLGLFSIQRSFGIRYVDFSMNRVRMLMHFGLVPYLVFDGDYLPSKTTTEVERANKREESKKRGLELYHMNKPSQAHLELQKAVDVTPTMARQLIEELKKAGVQYVVAPYEADAQLVYLEKIGVVHGILSEDSDLLVFGAKRLLTKLDQYGDCVEINRADFTACREISLVGWTDAEFRRMAILSGCDYLASINGMGLKNAYRLVRKYKTIDKIVRMLQFDGKFYVPAGYLEAFYRAELTFLHQRIFCPFKKATVMSNDFNQGTSPSDMSFVGAEVEQNVAIAVARGDLDPVTKAPIIVPTSSRDSPKTPGNSRCMNREGTTISEVKGNKSLDSFFRTKRTPLAELDPNIFTPSPTQERLLQQASVASWDFRPATIMTQPLHERDSTVASPSRLPMPSNRLNGATPGLSTGPTPSKKRRLFHETSDKADAGAGNNSTEVRSRYFTSNLNPNRAYKPGQKERKVKGSEISIWSDDSVEDAMAALADVEADVSSRKEKLDVFRDDEKMSKASLTKALCERESIPTEESQNLVSSRGTNSSEVSVSTAMSSTTSSASSTAQSLARFISAELAGVSTNGIHRHHTTKRTLRRTSSSSQQLEDPSQMPSSQKLGQAGLPPRQTMTPLQKLGAHALNRSRSYSGPVSRTFPPVYKDNARGEDLADHLIGEGVRRMPSLPLAHSIGPDASAVKGSEDVMIPDSEDDLSDTAATGDDLSRPRLSLGHFAFIE